MELALSKEDRAFAEQMRALFTSEIPSDIRDRLARGVHPTKDDIVTSQRILNAHGLAVPHWPVEWGGQNWTPLQRHIWSEEMQLAHVPHPLVFNTAMVGPVIADLRQSGAQGAVPGQDGQRSTSGGARASPSRTPAPTSPR